VYADSISNTTKMVLSAFAASDKACKEQVNAEGDGDECVVKPIVEKIRHQMYVLAF